MGKTIIEWEFQGYKAKSELDDLKINHLTKQIIITEYKTTWNTEDEAFARTYLKLRYDLAAIYYVKAVEYKFKEKYPDYEIKFQFLVIDTSPQGLRPLIYTLTNEDLDNAMNGFTTSTGYRYLGLMELIDEIQWSEENNEWKITRNAFENKSVLPLKINYEI